MPTENNKIILRLLLLMAFADKVFMEEGKGLIIDISKKLQIPDDIRKQIVNEIEKTENITEQCRITAQQIESQDDRNKTIKLLSELMATDKIIHKKELFAIQIIAEEWGKFLPKDE